MSATIAPQRQAAGSSFYLGMRVLPRPSREAMYAVYAFCRAVDDIADDHRGHRAHRAAALEGWRADLARLYAGGDGGQAMFLKPAIVRFGLPRADFDAVIDGMAMDVARDLRFPAAAELDLYCDRVASAVGRLSVRIFGMNDADGRALAYHLGRALQLTNILRDVDEDARIGRCYLSAEAIVEAGIPVGLVDSVIADPRIDDACRIVAKQATAHFDMAQRIMGSGTAGHLIAPRLMAAAYSSLLNRMVKMGWKPPRVRVRHHRLALVWRLIRLRLAR